MGRRMNSPNVNHLNYSSSPGPTDRTIGKRRDTPIFHRAAFPLAVVGAAAMLWAARLPVSQFPLSFLGLFCVALGGVCCLIELAARSGQRPKRPLFFLMPTPLVIISLAALLSTNTPRLLTFYVHKSALDRWAQKVTSSSNWPNTAQVGLYDFYDIGGIDLPGTPPGTIRCYINDDEGFLSEGGLVYSPSGKPPDQNCEIYTHAAGAWYFLYNDN